MKTDTYKLIAFEGIDGSGKSTIIALLKKHLNRKYKVYSEKLAYNMVEIYKELFDNKSGITGEYQNKLPEEFRMASYIIEAIVQMRNFRDFYNSFDYLLFDRWIYTNQVYLAEIKWNSEHFKSLIYMIPDPTITFYLDVDPEIALKRLHKKMDWMTQRYSDKLLLERFEKYIQKYKYMLKNKNVSYVDANLNQDLCLEYIINTLEKLD